MINTSDRRTFPTIDPPPAGRYRVAVSIDGAPFIQGWWNDRATADLKYRGWIGEHGGRPGVRVTLTDEETGETLTTWPAEA
jgi:hypothetical protein